MVSKNKIKVTPSDNVKVDESKHLITVDAGTKVTVQLADVGELTKEDLKKVRWVASMFHITPSNSRIHATEKGSRVEFTIPKIFSGGGLGWLEPILEGEKPKFKVPYGYFINSYGKPSIDRIEWRAYRKENNGPIISGDKFFTEAVQLHIYTTGLYGHDLKIRLKYFKYFKYINYELDLDEDVENDENVLSKFFRREVKVYKDPNDETKKEQKVIINIRIENSWTFAGDELEIVPIISSYITGLNKKTFDENALKVRKRKSEDRTIISSTKSGNKPTIIGNIVTDTAEFKPCFFTKIEATYSKGDEDTTAVIYDSKQGLKPTIMSFATVAGPRYARREVKIVLDTDLENCLYANNERLKHETRVIDLSEIEDAVVVESSSKNKGYRLTDKQEIIAKNLEFGQEDGDHMDNNDNDEFNKDHVFIKASSSTIVGGLGRVSGKVFNRPRKNYTDKATSDSEVIIEVPYKYGKTTKNERLVDVLKHIWPASKSNIQQYPIALHTCRQPNKLINVDVYPDIKWTLQFCYNSDHEKFIEVRKKYKDYQVRIEEVESDAKETYDSKIEHNEDLADKYKKLTKEIKRSGEKNEKKIKKLEKELKNLKGKEKIKTNRKLVDLKNRKKEFNNQQKKYKKRQEKYLEKSKKHQKSKKKYTKTNKNNEPSIAKPELYNFEDNLEKGLSDIVLSLWAEWDRPAEKFEVTAHYQKYKLLLENILKFKKFVEDIFAGKKKGNIDKKGKRYGKNNPKPKTKKPDATEAEMAKKLEIISAFAPKPLASVNIIPPSIALAGSWYAENPKSEKQNEIGTNLELAAILDPIVGAEIVLNFMALAQRAHPVANFALGMMELGGFEVRLDLTVSGAVFCKGLLQYNTTSGKNNITPGDIKDLKDPEDDAPLEIGGRIEMEVYAGIKYIKKYEAWGYEAEIKLRAYATVVTGITLAGYVEWIKDNPKYPDGVYLNPKLTFHGLTVSLVAKGEGEVNNDNDELIAEIDLESGGEFIVMDPYEAVLDFKIPLVADNN
ncbi:MAG: hypothetical protein L3J23_05940 [Flavobacteriaceae bacterium]|nr:hypothetical protein [Flavobacteriaceae bacterium]